MGCARLLCFVIAVGSLMWGGVHVSLNFKPKTCDLDPSVYRTVRRLLMVNLVFLSAGIALSTCGYLSAAVALAYARLSYNAERYLLTPSHVGSEVSARNTAHPNRGNSATVCYTRNHKRPQSVFWTLYAFCFIVLSTVNSSIVLQWTYNMEQLHSYMTCRYFVACVALYGGTMSALLILILVACCRYTAPPRYRHAPDYRML